MLLCQGTISYQISTHLSRQNAIRGYHTMSSYAKVWPFNNLSNMLSNILTHYVKLCQAIIEYNRKFNSLKQNFIRI